MRVRKGDGKVQRDVQLKNRLEDMEYIMIECVTEQPGCRGADLYSYLRI